ncbi:hypothetical protein ACNO5E_14295 [Vibrio parahaemolyticus]|uniref:hypothetical protein n=1 Tax=Vibrio parahaemolyticus TaxID=670 RepID=UPI000812D9DF|nr:hypothetical protein [Vibrio parahaemolyticus]OCP68463.1 hypothetical protein AKH08_16775 [Vibrio parahaemolyticus]
MTNMYLVTVKAQLLDQCGGVLTDVSDSHIAVVAKTGIQASKDAVAWLGDNDRVYHMSDHHDQEPVKYGVSCGHAIYRRRHQLRYVTIKAVKTNLNELETFFSLTSGLANKKIVERTLEQ